MMDTKQKSLLILTVAALGFLGYQIFQLVDRDITESPVIVESTASPLPSSSVASAQPMIQKQAMPLQKKLLIQGSSDNLSQRQNEYVQMLNQFELVKLHRQLLEEETAVATAQNQIAQLHSQTAKITGMNADDSNASDSPAFALNYIDQQDGEWSATLHIGSNYQSVTCGSLLSNGYQVVDINHQGVTLQKNQSRELLTFNGITALPNVPVVAKPAVLMKPVAVKPAIVTKPPVAQAAKPAVTTTAPLVHSAVKAPTPAVAKKIALLSMTPKQTIATKPSVVIDPPHPKMKLSIHDQYAQEDEDDLQNNELSQELHLPSVEIQPVVDQQAYSVNSYLPHDVAVPQTYHLDNATSSSTDEDQYASESSDDVSTFAPAPAVVMSHPSLSQAQFLAQPSHYYTVQLIGAPYVDVVHRYVRANKLEHSAIQLLLNNGKRPWTIAVVGVYPNKGAALAARARLPKHLRSNGAWVRKIGDIQKDMR